MKRGSKEWNDAVKRMFSSGVRGQESIVSLPDFGEVVECTAVEDMARQEYRLSSEIKYQIQQFGVGRPIAVGDVDFDNMDLTRALSIVESAQQAWLEMPKVLRDRYLTWANLEKAFATGEAQQVMKAAGIDGGGSPSVSAASASDSAAVDAPKGVPAS